MANTVFLTRQYHRKHGGAFLADTTLGVASYGRINGDWRVAVTMGHNDGTHYKIEGNLDAMEKFANRILTQVGRCRTFIAENYPTPQMQLTDTEKAANKQGVNNV